MEIEHEQDLAIQVVSLTEDVQQLQGHKDWKELLGISK